MSVDIYNTDFQNWLKGNLALTETRQALSGSVSTNIETYISEFPQDRREHIEQFITCLDENGIQQLKKQNKKEIECSCNHDLCKILFGLFTVKYIEHYALRYKWRVRPTWQTCPSTGHIDNDKQIWRIAMLYMFVEPGEKMENYQCLDDLDISKLLKMMRNCSLFVPDGSLEIYEQVIQFRNDLMHSPNNKVSGEYLQKKLEKTRDLLTILDLTPDCNLGNEDFIISYQSEEYKQVVAEVERAKQIAFDLYEEINVTNSSGRTHSKHLKDILEKICKHRQGPQLEMKPKKFKDVVKGFIEKKKEALELEKNICLHSCSDDSDRYKELEKLQNQTEQDLNDINEQLEKTGETEMRELIDHLNKDVTTLKSDKKKMEDEAKEMANTTDAMSKVITTLEIDKKKLEDETKKMANTIDNMNKVTAKRKRKESEPPQTTETESEEHVTGEFTASDSDSTHVNATVTQKTETGRPVSPHRDNSSNSWRKSPQRNRSGFSPIGLEVFKKPMCLISTAGKNVLKLETKAAEQIAMIDWPIVVVSGVGLDRTGKSYLMNRLAESTKGFQLGDTTESATKGLWVWCKIHPEKSNTVLLLLDTEGLGDVDKGNPSHDNKIFTLATLLCNCLVYNIKDAVNLDAVSKLSTLITDLAKNIRFRGKSSDYNSSLNLILPDFVLCVRDFSLKLTKNGKQITDDEYFEQVLAIKKRKGYKINTPRECVKQYFPGRKCFTLPVPGDRDVLENLETLDISQLSDRFNDATTRFVSYVYSCQPKKLLASKPINGQMFTTLASYYVTAIRSGAVLDVDDAFSATANIENSRIGKEALELFQKQMDTVIMPVPSKGLKSSYTIAQQMTVNYLRKNVVHDKYGQCDIKAQMEMEKVWNKLKEQNTQKANEMYDANIQQAYKVSMEGKIENKTYEVSGGYIMFLRDIQKMKKEFMVSLREFEENEIIWTWLRFMNTMEEKKINIIQADDALRAKEIEDSTQVTATSTQRTETESHKFDEELAARIKEVSLMKSSGFSPNDSEVFQKPMCFISVEGKNVLKLETKAAEQIAKIDWPIVVVAVVGLYRTGKSYLMNRLAKSTKGFALGDTIDSKTKGIWVWCKIHPEKSNTVLLLLDTEGLGDVDKGDPSHDNNIFTLATLLCNCLVYNMKGAFDQDAVSKLTFVTEMAKHIRFKGISSAANNRLNLILPDFVLCVRDFSLRLLQEGKQITEDVYLEQSLAIQKGQDDKFNKPRECIKKYFIVRKCFTFPVPGDFDVLENLETLEFSQLSDKFKEATMRFVSYIYSRQAKELLASKPINGQMFTTLATHYVTSIRNGAVLDVDDAFSAAAKIENRRIRKEAFEIFQQQMETVILPVSFRVLRSSYTKAQQIALDYLRKNVVHDKGGQCEINAQMEMANLWKTFKYENTQKVNEMCDVNIQAYKASVERNIENKTYEVSGGHRKFRQDIEKMKREYYISLSEFDENEILWTWIGFMKTIKETETKIIEADDWMAAKEKEDERKLNEKKMTTFIEQQTKFTQDALEHQKETLKEYYEMLQDNRQKHLESEAKKIEDLVRVKVDKELAEKELNRIKKEQERKKDR